MKEAQMSIQAKRAMEIEALREWHDHLKERFNRNEKVNPKDQEILLKIRKEINWLAGLHKHEDEGQEEFIKKVADGLPHLSITDDPSVRKPKEDD